MKKAILSCIIFSLFFLFTSVSAYAVDDTERWVCLQAEHCWKEPNTCSAAHKGNGHMAKLSAKAGFEPIPGISTYIVVCIATNNSQICTTGNEAADMQVYGKSNLAELGSSLDFKFEGLFKADGTSTVANPAIWAGPYEWGDSLPQGHMHKWLAMNYYDPTLSASGGAGGQQQGTFDFETAEKDCVSIAWDPYGRIFDATTLEPITGAQVTLLVKKSGSFVQMTSADLAGGNLTNPQTTLEDGNFSFVVPDGDYKLTVVPPMVTGISQVDVNYAKAYFDIYPVSTGDVIQQRGTIQHRDIPVLAASTSATPKMMEYFYETSTAGVVTVQGRVSHPLSKLIAGTSKVSATDPNVKTPYRTIGTFYADKWGRFDIKLDQDLFEETPDYIEVFSDLEIQKVDLRQNISRKEGLNLFSRIQDLLTWFADKLLVQAQSKTTVVKFEPIPQYLEGYAYDAYGKVIPNATVGVYLNMSKKPYAQTTADASGYFLLQPAQLPSYPYKLKYSAPGGQTVEASTSKFIAQNQKYIVQNKINPFVAKDIDNQIAIARATTKTTGAASSNAASGSKQSSGGVTRSGSAASRGGQTSSSATATQNPPNPILLILILLVILLGGVGVGVLLYMKNKQPSPTQW